MGGAATASVRVGAELIERSSAERDLGGGQQAECEPAVCHGGQKGQWDPRVHRTERGQQGEGGSIPFCSALGMPHPEHWAQCWAAQFKAGRELLGRAQRRAMERSGPGASPV